ncbi:MAG TPA: sigma-54 dependent transcriptional regulator [Bryobacteraceae bacterium]|jgi:DNA-binding NtrC family response regulator|nr:sigma-54 dependent transcriptional regulator [Bryobacteraceae bacterium]
MKILWLADSTLAPDPAQLLSGAQEWQVTRSLGEALFELEQERDAFEVGIVCLPLTEDDAGVVVEEMLRVKRSLPILFIRESGTAAEAVQLLQLGAYHYFDRYPEKGSFTDFLARLSARQGGPAAVRGAWRQMVVGNSPAMEKVTDMVALIAGRRSTVLILGETGSGKEVIARAIHQASPRAGKPMIAVNCAAIPDNLLEAELFGHVKGAFTGATNARIGRFEQADEGTLFLDEIADLTLDLQAKLLRVLQEREFQRVGSSETTRVDVRVIAATNGDLLERVKQGKFREDLYYRLHVVPIRIPALRERAPDIPLLVQHFIRKICDQEKLPLKTASAEALQRLCQYPWPGNVRQLENVVEMAIVLSGDRTILLPPDFTLPAQATPKLLDMGEAHIISLPEDGLDFEVVIGRIELNLLEQALERARGNKKLAADMLRLKRTTLAAKLKSLEALTCGQAK